METFSYIMTLATSKAGADVFLAVRNIAGTGRPQYGRGDGFGKVELWIVPKSKKSREELEVQLQALPFVQQVSVVALSKPVTGSELAEVRTLFNGLGWDTTGVKDEDLSSFLDARLQGKYTYLIDFAPKQGGTPEKLRIIPAEDHPHFSPEWLINDSHEGELSDRELTMEDLEIRTVVLEQIVEVLPPSPPPPTGGEHS